MNQKLLVVVGPTATGKTKLALKLAEEFNGELVSADSRQVYKGMDVGTGKDVPSDFEYKTTKMFLNRRKIGYYTNGKVRIWGYDLVGPKEEYSVAAYIKMAERVLDDIWQRDKLPILVGGTGLYIRAVIKGVDTVRIPKNKSLRKSLEKNNAKELFEILAQLDSMKAASMNISDKKNPRRLIRAIEVANSGQNKNPKSTIIKDTLFIGLKVDKDKLKERIDERINKRLQQGIEGEIKNLLADGVSWKNQSMSSMGYKQWRGYFEKRKSKNDVLEEWSRAEKKYAKRQVTWFKGEKRINWANIQDKHYPKKVEKLVKKWYAN